MKLVIMKIANLSLLHFIKPTWQKDKRIVFFRAEKLEKRLKDKENRHCQRKESTLTLKNSTLVGDKNI